MPPTFLAFTRHVLSHELFDEEKIAIAGFYEGPGNTNKKLPSLP